MEIFQSTGSTTQFSLLSFFYVVPMLVLSPFAGALVDRWDRRLVMLLSDLGSGVGSLLIWAMFAATKAGYWHFESWHYFAAVTLSASASAFHWPAYQASTVLLVPKQHLGRANGLIDLAGGVGQVAAPVIAGALMVKIGLQGILLIDLGSFLFAVGTLLFVRFPQYAPEGIRKSLWQDVAFAWTFIRERSGLFWLMIYLFAFNLVLSLVSVLITPLVLSFADVTSLGLVVTVGGMGVLGGSILMGIWGGGRRLMTTVLIFQLLGGVALIAAGGWHPSVLLLTVTGFLFLFTDPFVSGCVLTIWQRKVVPGMQGRIMAVRRMIILLAPPVSTLIAGPLADQLFEPWLAHDGALAGSVGRLIGTGPGRGLGLIFVVLGVLSLAIAPALRMISSVWNVETELPDAIDDEVPGQAADQPAPGDVPARAGEA